MFCLNFILTDQFHLGGDFSSLQTGNYPLSRPYHADIGDNLSIGGKGDAITTFQEQIGVGGFEAMLQQFQAMCLAHERCLCKARKESRQMFHALELLLKHEGGTSGQAMAQKAKPMLSLLQIGMCCLGDALLQVLQ